MSDLTDLYSALDSAHTKMALSSQDWSVAPDFAWLYGILVGWSDDPTGGDVDQVDALGELATRFGWSSDVVDRLRRLRAAVAGFDLNRAADLDAAVKELAQKRALFEMQWQRMGEATDMWRAEDPEARALVQPDLGDLLLWLMDKARHAAATKAPAQPPSGGTDGGWPDPVTGLISGSVTEPEYPLRCQHCLEDLRLLPNGAYEDRRGFMRCRKAVDHKPMPSVGV